MVVMIPVSREELLGIRDDIWEDRVGNASKRIGDILREADEPPAQGILESGYIEEYRANVESMNHFMPESLREKMRAIRLWHWNQIMGIRSMQERYPETVEIQVWLDSLAGEHMTRVQALNDFFPDVGDTAERDASK